MHNVAPNRTAGARVQILLSLVPVRRSRMGPGRPRGEDQDQEARQDEAIAKEPNVSGWHWEGGTAMGR